MVVLSTLVVLAAIALLFTCLRTGLSLPEWVQGQRGPVERVVRSDVASVSFITVLITTASVVVLVYEVFRILGPGPSNCPVRAWRGPVSWIATTYFALAAAAVLYSHARLLPPGASAWPGRSGAPPSGAPSSPVSLFTGGVPTPVAATSGSVYRALSFSVFTSPAVGPCAAVSLCARPLAALLAGRGRFPPLGGPNPAAGRGLGVSPPNGPEEVPDASTRPYGWSVLGQHLLVEG